MEDVLELDTRHRVYEAISKNPGLHLSKIAELLSMRVSHVEYHINFLEKHDVVIVDRSTGYNRAYVKGTVGTKDKAFLAVLRQRTVLHIVHFLLQHESVIRHKDLLDHIDISPATLSYHLRKLVAHGIIELQRNGSDQGYRLKDQDAILSWLVRFRPFDVYEEFAHVWDDLSP